MKNGTFNQLCVWEGVLLGESTVEEFESFFKDDGFRVKFADEYKTLPDVDENGLFIEDTGGRNDLLFYINDEDVAKFAIWRLRYGIRWWEDFLANGHGDIVPKEILDKYPYGW